MFDRLDRVEYTSADNYEEVHFLWSSRPKAYNFVKHEHESLGIFQGF